MLFPIRRLLHWGPIGVLCIIKLITWCTVHNLGMYWPPHESFGGLINGALFILLSGLTLYYFLQALLEGPGFVTHQWKPVKESDKIYLQFCSVCNGYKAPRSHHCKKCGRCVMKMDHHCPWINCCVGHMNHGYFTKFLTFAVLGCFHAACLLIVAVYHALHLSWYVRRGVGPRVQLTLTTLVLTLLSIGMAIGVVVAVGFLLYLQLRGIVRNITTIEEWIMEKAHSRRLDAKLPPLIFPYDLGRARNLKEVVCGPRGDGVTWPLTEGAGEYDLTLEQISQKEEKRSRARTYIVSSEYDGGWVPLLSRPRAACAPPCSDEPRLPLSAGDAVTVTRHAKRWLFGEKVVSKGRGPRGWFPRDAVLAQEAYCVKND